MSRMQPEKRNSFTGACRLEVVVAAHLRGIFQRQGKHSTFSVPEHFYGKHCEVHNGPVFPPVQVRRSRGLDAAVQRLQKYERFESEEKDSR